MSVRLFLDYILKLKLKNYNLHYVKDIYIFFVYVKLCQVCCADQGFM